MEMIVTKQGFFFRGTVRELQANLASWRRSEMELRDLICLNLH